MVCVEGRLCPLLRQPHGFHQTQARFEMLFTYISIHESARCTHIYTRARARARFHPGFRLPEMTFPPPPHPAVSPSPSSCSHLCASPFPVLSPVFCTGRPPAWKMATDATAMSVPETRRPLFALSILLNYVVCAPAPCDWLTICSMQACSKAPRQSLSFYYAGFVCVDVLQPRGAH